MNRMNLSLLLTMLLFSLLLSAQGWERTYDLGYSENTSNADLTLDGGVIVSGVLSNNSTGIEYPFLSKINPEGDLVWSFIDSLHSATFVNTLALKSTSDGAYLLSMLYGNNPPNNNSIVIKIAEDGTVIWEYILPITDSQYITQIIEDSDGNYYVFGQREDPSNFRDVTVKKLSALGELIWEQNYSSSVEEAVFPGGITQTANGDLIITGYQGFANDSQDAYVKRLSNTGAIIWEMEYNNTDNDFTSDVVEMANGDLVIGGLSSTDFSWFQPTLHRIDSEGNTLWYNTYPSLEQGFGFGGIQKTSDEGIAFAGSTTSFSNGVSDYFLMKTDGEGNEIWSNIYGMLEDDYLREVVITPENEFYLAGYTKVDADNDDIYVVKADSLGNSFINVLSGNIYHDVNEDCIQDVSDPGLEQWLLEATKGDIQYMRLTDEFGNYSFNLDTGAYEIKAYPISYYWGFCDNLYTVDFPIFGDTLVQDFAAVTVIDCPLMDVSIGTPFLRRCFENTYYVKYCNYGTIDAADASLEIILDPYMQYIESSIPLANQLNDTLIFEVGDVAVGDCETFQVTVLLDVPGTEPCDSIPFGLTHCVEARVYPDSICIPASNWSGASVEVNAVCSGDSIIFFIENVGIDATQANLEYYVIEDDVILFQGNLPPINPGESEIVTVQTNGSTFRLEVDQEPNHPGFSMPSITVEGCGTDDVLFNFGFVNLFSPDDANPSVDIDCDQNIGAYDPNDKTGFPLGISDQNYIDEGQQIEYFIRFQNTGTDTAFNIVILDTLSQYLDASSVRPGASSHPYAFDIVGDGVLSFSFNNIMLPDSNVNEAASNGFVKFKIDQAANLPLGTQILNSAAIFFDFNAPVITNETLHTIGEDYLETVSVYPDINSLASVKVFPNPFKEATTIEVENFNLTKGRFMLYDSMGRLLRSENINNNRHTFYRDHMSKGIYFFTIEDQGTLITSGKLIVE